MKKLQAILLICCFLIPYAGTVWLYYQKTLVRKEVKRQMIAGIAKEELVLLKFTVPESKTNLRWEHSKEFEYDGEMYDVVSSETKGDSVFYWCWWDRKETKLNKQLDNLVAQTMEHNPQQKEQQQRLANFFKECSHIGAFSRNDGIYSSQQSVAGYILPHYSSVPVSPPDPPPWKS